MTFDSDQALHDVQALTKVIADLQTLTNTHKTGVLVFPFAKIHAATVKLKDAEEELRGELGELLAKEAIKNACESESR